MIHLQGALASKKMLVSKIERGIVIDHISPCKGLQILKLLNPGPEATVVMAKNVASTKFGRKDLVKIEGEYLTSTQVDMIALISPTATVNIIESREVKEKKEVRPPSELRHLIDCRNPLCPSKGLLSRFVVVLKEPLEHSYFECKACGHRVYYEEGIEEVLKGASAGILISREKVQAALLDLLTKKGGLRLGQKFRLKSGRVSPFFVNLGALNDGESLSRLRWVLAGFVRVLLDEGKLKDFDFVFGPAYKGINLAALTCEGLNEYIGLNRRYLYDRKEEKLYGDTTMDRQIVGGEYFKEGQRVLVVDDTVTTGQTKIESIRKLSALGSHELVGVVVCVDRQETSGEAGSAAEHVKRKLGVEVHSILTATDIYHMIKGMLSDEERAAWLDYYAKYGAVKLE